MCGFKCRVRLDLECWLRCYTRVQDVRVQSVRTFPGSLELFSLLTLLFDQAHLQPDSFMSPSTMSPEILHGILLTVQRLESALDGLDERLRVLELSTARDLSRRDHQEPIPQRLGAADYQKSAQRLRQLYVFDSQSALSLPGANPALDTQNLHADVGGYCRPMSSVYSSRPLSRLDIDAFPAETQGK